MKHIMIIYNIYIQTTKKLLAHKQLTTTIFRQQVVEHFSATAENSDHLLYWASSIYMFGCS
jgi:hypothetical protein